MDQWYQIEKYHSQIKEELCEKIVVSHQPTIIDDLSSAKSIVSLKEAKQNIEYKNRKQGEIQWPVAAS